MKYSLTCSCEEVFSVEAASRAEAVAKMKSLMHRGLIKTHSAGSHKGDLVPTEAEMHATIEKNLKVV